MCAGMQHMHTLARARTRTHTHVTKHHTTKAYKVENEHFHLSLSRVLWLEEVPPHTHTITLTEPWVSQPEAKNTSPPTASKDMTAEDYSICLPSAG